MYFFHFQFCGSCTLQHCPSRSHRRLMLRLHWARHLRLLEESENQSNVRHVNQTIAPTDHILKRTCSCLFSIHASPTFFLFSQDGKHSGHATFLVARVYTDPRARTTSHYRGAVLRCRQYIVLCLPFSIPVPPYSRSKPSRSTTLLSNCTLRPWERCLFEVLHTPSTFQTCCNFMS